MAFISVHGLMLSIVAQTEPQPELQNLFSVRNSQLLLSIFFAKSCLSGIHLPFTHTALSSSGCCVTIITSVVHIFHSRNITSSAQLLFYYLGISSWMAVPTQYLITEDFYPAISCAFWYVDITNSFSLGSRQ